MLLGYREKPSFFAVGRRLGCIIRRCSAASSERWPMARLRHLMTDRDRAKSRRSRRRPRTRRKHDTKSHHNNCDWIISGNLEHRETPKIADFPAWSTTKAKTVQNCSDRTLQIAPTTEPHSRFSTMSNRTPRSEWIGLIDQATSSVDGIDATDQARLYASHLHIARNKEQNRSMGVWSAGRLSGKSWR